MFLPKLEAARKSGELLVYEEALWMQLAMLRRHRASRCGKTQGKSKARLYAGFCAARRRAVAVIPLGRRSRTGSSHLPAASPSRIAGCLFGVAPRRDCPFHPPCFARTRFAGGLSSAALILTSRWPWVTCYAALRVPAVPLRAEPPRD